MEKIEIKHMLLTSPSDFWYYTSKHGMPDGTYDVLDEIEAEQARQLDKPERPYNPIHAIQEYVLAECFETEITEDQQRSIDLRFELATRFFSQEGIPPASISFSEDSLYGYWRIGYWGVDCEFFNDRIVLTADDLRPPLSITKAKTKTINVPQCSLINVKKEVIAFLSSLPLEGE